jgi:hypothetical protein
MSPAPVSPRPIAMLAAASIVDFFGIFIFVLLII